MQVLSTKVCQNSLPAALPRPLLRLNYLSLGLFKYSPTNVPYDHLFLQFTLPPVPGFLSKTDVIMSLVFLKDFSGSLLHN